jgi:hypothetical protein
LSKILRLRVSTIIRRHGRSNNTFFNIEAKRKREKKKHQNHYHNNKSDKQPMLEGRARTDSTAQLSHKITRGVYCMEVVEDGKKKRREGEKKVDLF